MTPRTYPGRDKRRLMRRAKSLHAGQDATTNQRARCCSRPSHVEVPDAAVFTTRCRNCGATV